VLDIVVTDRYCDLALERIDLAIRIGQPARDRQLVTRQLAAHDYGVIATPGYLAGTGVPHEPAALKEHECLCLFDHLGRTSAMAVAYGLADAPTAAVSAASSVAPNSGPNRTPLRARWNFERGVTTQSVNVHGRLLANSLEIVFEGVLAHRGVALLPCWLIERHVRQGHLQRLFAAFDVSPHQGRSVVYAAHLPNRRHSTKVRVFTEFLAARLASFQVF
jgi:DNA-binding transcriptional LysR family regulator